MEKSINLFYLSKNNTGGWVTYTCHLINGLRSLGCTVNLYKVGNRTEAKERNFGYGISYRNLDLEDSLTLDGDTVIVALQKNYREISEDLILNGAWMVVHDPAEFKHIDQTNGSKFITIRKAVNKQLPDSHLVLHPYERHFKKSMGVKRKNLACSIARIDFDKHTTILLDANRILKSNQKIQIHGFENRLYTRFKVCPEYPEWEQSVSAYERTQHTAAEICRDAKFAVDMSVIKKDGGGTQYTFLEAMDAGAINVIHKDWIRPNDEMKAYPNSEANCFAVSNGKELVQVLTKKWESSLLKKMVIRSNKLLKKHEPTKIATKFLRVLGG